MHTPYHPAIAPVVAYLAILAKTRQGHHGESDENPHGEGHQVRFRPADRFRRAEPVAVEEFERLTVLNCASGRHGDESEGEGVTMERRRSRKTPSDNDAKSNRNHNTRLQG